MYTLFLFLPNIVTVFKWLSLSTENCEGKGTEVTKKILSWPPLQRFSTHGGLFIIATLGMKTLGF